MADSIDRDEIVVDLNTRILDDDERVHILFPGRAHSLYEHMASHSVVYLDLPALPLRGKDDLETKEFLQELSISEAVQKWHLGDKTAPYPSLIPDDYDVPTGRAISRLLGAIRTLYYELKDGDLVVVPGPGYWSDVLIGEIVGGITTTRNPLYDRENIPARRVKWLARREKRLFSHAFIDRLGLPNYLITLEKSLNDELFRATFPNYIYNGKIVARFTTTERHFTTLDEFRIQSFVNYVVGVYGISESDNPHLGLSLDEAIDFLSNHPHLVPSLTTNINSPGALTVISSTLAPLVLAALVGVASVQPAAAHTPNVRITNSSAPHDDVCTVRIDESVRQSMVLMDLDEWKRSCEKLQRAKEKTGLKSSVSARHHQGAKKSP